MSKTTLIFRSFWLFLLIFTISLVTFADTIRLKDGSFIKGRIISFAGGKFVVVIGEGSRTRQMTFASNEIESITFDQSGQNAGSTQNVSYKNDKTDQPRPATDSPRVIVSENLPSISTPQKQTPTVPKPSVVIPKQPSPATTNIKPIELSVKVLADSTNNGWTNTGWVVKKGQHIRISGDGTVSLGKGQTSQPGGLPDLDDSNKLLKNVATGALIAVIGDDNNDFVYIGASREFTATRDGALFLGVNEGNLDDNTGSYVVKVKITPEAPINN